MKLRKVRTCWRNNKWFLILQPMYTLLVPCDLLEETVVKAVLQQRHLNMIITSVTEDSRI